MALEKTLDWWRGAVIYQIYPRSFADSDGDGVGDLPGIVDKLDYVAALGVDAIWLSPFFTSPMKDFGYDIADYRGVDPLFGTLEDFDRLTARAHELGLRVMIDQVLSHTSDRHAWFVESRSSRDNEKADWYVWAEPKADGTAPNNWLAIFGGSAWQWDSHRRQYYLHNFLTSQPDLNFHCTEVQDALLSEVEFWLERGVDGFRLDTVNFYAHDSRLRDNPPRPAELGDLPGVSHANPYTMQWHLHDKTQPETLGFLKRLRALLERYPGTATVGEIGADDSLAVMAEYTSGGDKLHMAYSFDLLGSEFSADFVRRTVERAEAALGDGWPCWSLGNHDTARVVTRWGGEGHPKDFAIMLGAMAGSLRGSLCLYQGEELGLPEAEVPFERLQDPYGIELWPEFKGRDGCRTPMPWIASRQSHGGFTQGQPWLPVPEVHLERNAAGQQAVPTSVLAGYRRFLDWRRNHSALRQGSIRFLDAPGDLLAFERRDEAEALLCVFNTGARDCTWRPDGLNGIEPLEGHGLAGGWVDGEVQLPAFGALFAKLPAERGGKGDGNG
jgi:alpha-glucosidase